MELEDFYALRAGPAPMAEGETAVLSVRDLGILRVPSGLLGASDPFVYLDQPVVVPIAPGDYPVSVTIADVSPEHDGSHLREAFLSVILSAAESVSVGPAITIDGAPEPGLFFTVGVDAGTVSFVDAEAVARCMPVDPSTWYDDVFAGGSASWFSIMDAAEPLPKDLANIVMPLATAGENVILAHSGWGDGAFPLLATRDSSENLTGIHIHLLVVGKDDDEEGDS